jgi:hypothetical protein
MFDTRLHEYWKPPQSERSRALIDRMCGARRAEARAAADRLDAIGELFELRRATDLRFGNKVEVQTLGRRISRIWHRVEVELEMPFRGG